jgi:2-phospho-L-lactate/phosphoenolpyruvate guanylyltransferase
MPTPAMPPRFGLLVPVKPASHAKSRLAPLGDEVRRQLVGAFAADTVTAALQSPAVGVVMVVTDDHEMARGLSDLGAHVLPDGTVDDLNESLTLAAAEVRRRWPDLALAALCADVPALRVDELTAALETALGHHAAFVPDAAEEGTTMVAAVSVDHFLPQFGHRSREAHLAAGSHEIREIHVPTLRRDVDTPADLLDALRLGVGSRTAAVAAGLRL